MVVGGLLQRERKPARPLRPGGRDCAARPTKIKNQRELRRKQGTRPRYTGECPLDKLRAPRRIRDHNLQSSKRTCENAWGLSPMIDKRRSRLPIPLLTVLLGVSCIGKALPVAHATTIAGIRTPAQVVIAADSLGTARGYRIESTQPVCKIFAVKDSAFAIAGLVRDPVWNFDAENLTADILRRKNRVTETANDLTERLEAMLGSYLERLKKGNPYLYGKLLEEQGGTVTSILLAAYEGDQPVAIGISFRASEEMGGRVKITATRVACPGDCPDGVMYFFLGERRPIDRYIAEHGRDRLGPADSAAPFLVQLVIDGGSKLVGPPIDVIVIDRQGVSWLARKEGCGGAPSP